ncbi:MAG: HAD family hydrolase [Erysipelotrichaceae bacterium]|nr:HAD family hydrolase [Erysipelotrichaceae bacterium]
MYKIAFFDMDGTLLRFHHKNPTENTIKALRALQQKGVLVAVATGRPASNVPKIEGFEFDLFLTFNGSYCFMKDGTEIFSNPLDSEDVAKLIDNANRINKPLTIAGVDFMVSNWKDENLQEYFNIGSSELIVSNEFTELSKHKVYQMMSSVGPDDYDDILEGTKNTTIVAWWDKAGDIIPKTGGKGVAVKAVLDYLNIDVSEAIAFGDGFNDKEMLKAVGNGVAMGNAKDDVKAIANNICLSVDEDGVYHYLKDNMIIE